MTTYRNNGLSIISYTLIKNKIRLKSIYLFTCIPLAVNPSYSAATVNP